MRFVHVIAIHCSCIYAWVSISVCIFAYYISSGGNINAVLCVPYRSVVLIDDRDRGWFYIEKKSQFYTHTQHNSTIKIWREREWGRESEREKWHKNAWSKPAQMMKMMEHRAKSTIASKQHRKKGATTTTATIASMVWS